MAGESCVFKPSVRNKNGEVVSSKLFDSLLHYSSNDREFSKKYYYVGTNQEFLDLNQDKVKYDENGEITFKSLKDIVSFNLPEEKLIAKLNSDLGAGEVEYNKAISLMKGFNSTNPYNDKFMATISNVKNGKVLLKVVRKNVKEEEILKQNIQNKSLFDSIEQAIRNLGGTVELIDKEYNELTEDTINALYKDFSNIVYVSRGGKLTKSAAEGAGLFAVSALSNHPLVKRLVDYCTPERQKQLLGERYNEVKNKPNSNLLTAGILIGEHIFNEAHKKSPIRNLLDRLIRFFNNLFHRYKEDDIRRIKIESELLAEQIAKGFIEQKLENPEYKEDDSIQISSFKNIIKELHNLSLNMQAIDKSSYDKWKNIEAVTTIGRIFKNKDKNNVFANICALDGITEAIKQLADATPEMIEMLDSVNFNVAESSINARKLRQVKAFVQSSLNIMLIIDNMLAKNPNMKENIKVELESAYKILNNLIRGGSDKLAVQVQQKERKLFTAFLEDVYGSKYIERASKVLFNPKNFKLIKVEGKKESIESLVDQLSEDDNFINRYIVSMSNSSDIINQLADRTRKAAEKQANDNTLKSFNIVKELEEKAKKLNINTNRLLERDRYDNLTGNYISEVNWGEWEKDWLEFKQSSFRQFKEENKHKLKDKTRIEQELLWDVYFRPLSKDWHKMHSTYDKQTGKYIPRNDEVYTNYKNEEYSKLSLQERTFLNELLEVKQELDDLLVYQAQNGSIVEVAHTHRLRMPQFRGSTQNRIENLKRNTSIIKASSKVLRENIMNAFIVNSEDRDYGSAVTRNTIDEEVFGNILDFELEKVNRLPIYGVNKFKDPSEISTDLFAGLIQYAAMAHTYAATSMIVDVLETGKDVLAARIVTDKNSKAKVGFETRSYKRYCDFMDGQIYNLYSRKDFKLGKLAISKILKTLNSIASKLFLGGNIAGGIVNTLTGFNEITKEAIAGEVYNLADLKKANLIYAKYLPSNIINSGQNLKYDKVSLFMRKFNVQNNMEETAREYSTRKSRLSRLNPFGDNLLLPYKSGDHYMQSMSYLAAANHYKFKDGDRTISMWDALEEKFIDESNPKLGKTLEFKKGVKFIDPKTKEEREWTMDDELTFQNLCRETNNRMHGIYNKLDKTAFHNTIFGQAVLGMRGYALGIFYRRFGLNQYNVTLGRDDEGSMITFSKMLLNIFSGDDALGSIIAILCPFGERTRLAVLDMGFSESQYRNLRRNWADFALIAILSILKGLTTKDEDDDNDDEEENRFEGLAFYFTNRLLMEQSAYNTPQGLWTESKSVLDWMPSGISVLGQMYQLAALIATQDTYAQKSALHEEGDLKWEYKLGTYFPYVRFARVWEHPYEAAESYSYGKATYK